MSTNESAVPVAPVAAEAPVTTGVTSDVAVTPTETATAPKNAAEFRQGLKDRVAGKLNAPAKVDARGRGHAPDGKFTEGSFPAAPEAPVDTQAVTPSADVSVNEAATAPPVQRIEIPEGNPLRDRGRRYVDELTPDELRGVLNTPIKQREIETTRQQYMAAQQELMRAQAVIEALKEQRTQALSSPEFAANYNALLEADPAVAELYRKGYEANLEAAIGSKTQEADSQFQEQQAQQAALQFTGEVFNTALQGGVIQEWWLKDHLKPELAAFGYRISNGFSKDASVGAAINHLTAAYLQHPHVAEFYKDYSAKQRQQLEAQIRQQAEQAAAEATRKQMELAASANRQTNPLGRMQGATGQTIPVQSGIQSAAQARQRLKERATRGVVR